MSISNKKVTRQDVLHMAQLSRLTVEEADVDKFADQLSAILSYMDVLEKVDTTDVEPLYSPAFHPSIPRNDIAKNTRTCGEILANAPEHTDEYFVVPRIV